MHSDEPAFPDARPAEVEIPFATGDLVARARASDAAARDELLCRLRPGLLDRIEVMMGPEARRHAEAHDIAHDVLLEVLRDLDRFTPQRPGSLLRWACRIARHRICDELRHRHEAVFDSFAGESAELRGGATQGTPSAEFHLDEARERVADALLALSEEYRTVVVLRHFEGLRFDAIAERMGRSSNAVQILHARALLRLGAMLKELDPAS